MLLYRTKENADFGHKIKKMEIISDFLNRKRFKISFSFSKGANARTQ